MLAKLVDVAEEATLMAAAPMTHRRRSDSRSSTFESLRVRNFRLFFSGQLISQIGNWLTLIAQALLVLKLTDSGFALGPPRGVPVRAGAGPRRVGRVWSPTAATSASC